jgi:ketosteroid isomerase-like protein
MAVASSEERERIARAGFEAFNAGDHAALLALLSEDVEVFASPELANAGRFHGHDGYLKWIEPWTEVWETLEMAVTQTTPVGERHVVATVHQTAQGRAGIEVSMDVAFVFEAKDGRVSYLALMPSADQAVELAREREIS